MARLRALTRTVVILSRKRLSGKHAGKNAEKKKAALVGAGLSLLRYSSGRAGLRWMRELPGRRG